VRGAEAIFTAFLAFLYYNTNINTDLEPASVIPPFLGGWFLSKSPESPVFGGGTAAGTGVSRILANIGAEGDDRMSLVQLA
jgi:hypothetical protein